MPSSPRPGEFMDHELAAWRALRRAWGARINELYPEDETARRAPYWPHFDRTAKNVRRDQSYDEQRHRAKRVGSGLESVLAAVGARELVWKTEGVRQLELAEIRALMWRHVQAVAGYDMVLHNLYPRGDHRREVAPAEVLSELDGWAARQPCAPARVAVLAQDWLPAAEQTKGDKGDGAQVRQLLTSGESPAGGERIRFARGLRHLIAHGALSPSRIIELGLEPWLREALRDTVVVAFALAARALPPRPR